VGPDRPWQAFAVTEVYQLLRSGENGLTPAEAARRLAGTGPNELKSRPPRSLFAIFVSQFKFFLIYILMAAMIISLLIGEAVDAGIIAAIVLLNAILGAYQEQQAEHSL
jgi:P-type Ca2+ transporter type 2C